MILNDISDDISPALIFLFELIVSGMRTALLISLQRQRK